MLFFIISIFIIFILILVFPFKITVIYSNKNLNISIYNFHFKKNIKNSNITKKKTTAKNNNKEKVKKRNKALKITLERNKFKPKVNIYTFCNYDLEDAANVAIIYGIIQNLIPYIYKYLSKIIEFKNFNYSINPLFKNKNFIEFKFEGIFYISLVKIIYIYISFKINYKNLKKT
ncbi:DUF2953 domain-containing protein [Clostridium botulinum]|nr:DUF2953 domain-containing protein [Clostridium botulinum]